MTAAPRTSRAAARAELTASIKTIARRHLGESGAAGLSLRAVARELGMVSSAVYRYFPSRDDLLTALITDAYNTVGERAETAAAQADDASPTARWLAVHRAVRDWALEHRHEFALLYGTPVPGYAAPPETTVAAARMPLVLARIAAESPLATPPGAPTGSADLLTPQIREMVGPLAANPTAAARVVIAWSGLLGLISAELFGHYVGVVTDTQAFFEHAVTTGATELGLPD